MTFISAMLPGERLLRVVQRGQPAKTSSPLLKGLTSFLQEALPSEVLKVEDSAANWSLSAVVFIDYVPVYLEARSMPQVGIPDVETACLRATSPNDIVKFHELVYLAELFLVSSGFKVLGPCDTGAGAQLRGPAVLIDEPFSDDVEDELADDELVWSQRLQPLLADALATHYSGSTSCEEAAQALGRLSESGSAACRVALARAFVEKMDDVVKFLQAQAGALAEAYPLAAALKFTAFCPKAAETLAGSQLPGQLNNSRPTTGPSLLVREVENILRVISEVRLQVSDEDDRTILAAEEPTRQEAEPWIAPAAEKACARTVAAWGRRITSDSTACSMTWQPFSIESLPRFTNGSMSLNEDDDGDDEDNTLEADGEEDSMEGTKTEWNIAAPQTTSKSQAKSHVLVSDMLWAS